MIFYVLATLASKGVKYKYNLNMNEKSKQPFGDLGIKLKKMREAKKESLAQVCSAVEIDVKQLLGIESGHKRPTEEVLLMLISHFQPKDEDAMSLWKLAGYDNDELQSPKQDNFQSNKPMVVFLAVEGRAIYSDNTKVVVNNSGVTLDFMQKNGPANQSLAVSRIGISREHAKKLVETLSLALAQLEKAKDQTSTKSVDAGLNTDETPKN